jgi:hypothetical protein
LLRWQIQAREGSTPHGLYSRGRHRFCQATTLRDGAVDTNALSIRSDADLGFELGHVEAEQSVTCYFLLDESLAHGFFKAFRP